MADSLSPRFQIRDPSFRCSTQPDAQVSISNSQPYMKQNFLFFTAAGYLFQNFRLCPRATAHPTPERWISSHRAHSVHPATSSIPQVCTQFLLVHAHSTSFTYIYIRTGMSWRQNRYRETVDEHIIACTTHHLSTHSMRAAMTCMTRCGGHV